MASDHEEEQPIDLSSKLPIKETKVTKALPPLIPIHEIRRRFEGGILPKRVTTHGVILPEQIEGSSKQSTCPKIINHESCNSNSISIPGKNSDIDFQEEISSLSGPLVDSEISKWKYPAIYDKLIDPYSVSKEERNVASEKEDKFSIDDVSPSCSMSSDTSSGDEPFRKSLRPLTGKHVRPGTGARAETLLTLRRKIQQRQQKGGVI